MKLFNEADLREAFEHAEQGGQALHLFGGAGLYPGAPACFKGPRRAAHLIDMDVARLTATAMQLGVKLIKIGRKGVRGQHVDLCGTPLKRALVKCSRQTPGPDDSKSRLVKAISLWQPWASMIADGKKTIETRPWATKYRGELLICSTKLPRYGYHPLGKALCICDLVDCRAMSALDESAACCTWEAGRQAWVLANIRPIQPFSVQGKQRLFEVLITNEMVRLTNRVPAELNPARRPVRQAAGDSYGPLPGGLAVTEYIYYTEPFDPDGIPPAPPNSETDSFGVEIDASKARLTEWRSRLQEWSLRRRETNE